MNTVQNNLLDALNTFRQHTGEENIRQGITARYAEIPNIDKLSIADLDIIEIIDNYPNLRISEIVLHTHFTQSAVSKILNKLSKYEFINKHQVADNKKNTYIALTAAGSVIAKAHKEFHQMQAYKLQQALAPYSEADLAMCAKIIGTINDVRN